MSTHLETRFANVRDVPVILNFIRALTAYEKLAHEVVATEEILRKSLFNENPKAVVIRDI
jgi:hypothetical protein